MKFILLLSLISISSLSFSNENPSKADVLQAIKSSLINKDLDCISLEDRKSDKASNLNFSVLESLSYTMTINEAEQPVIAFSAMDGKEEYVSTFTTNTDFTVIEGIETVSNTLTKAIINTGTITRPNIEEKIVKKSKKIMVCK